MQRVISNDVGFAQWRARDYSSERERFDVDRGRAVNDRFRKPEGGRESLLYAMATGWNNKTVETVTILS